MWLLILGHIMMYSVILCLNVSYPNYTASSSMLEGFYITVIWNEVRKCVECNCISYPLVHNIQVIFLYWWASALFCGISFHEGNVWVMFACWWIKVLKCLGLISDSIWVTNGRKLVVVMANGQVIGLKFNLHTEKIFLFRHYIVLLQDLKFLWQCYIQYKYQGFDVIQDCWTLMVRALQSFDMPGTA